jgi:hypothetical protein
MNDEIEQLLSRLTPRGARPELRPQVLDAVASQLRAEPASPWLRWSALAVAASLLAGIGLNVWVSRASERHLARLFGPPPISKRAMEVANDVAKITDAETGRWVYQRLTVPRTSANGQAAYAKYCAIVKRLIDELQSVSKDTYHATPEKDIEMERDRSGRTGGDRTGCQRPVRLDYRYAA